VNKVNPEKPNRTSGQTLRKLVFQSDFGLGDGAVSAMKGIAWGVNGQLVISDVTHDITPFNIWEASYRLYQVMDFWPEGTVFVSVVDPGVGTGRKSVAARLRGDRYIVTPDNGTLSHLIFVGSVLEVREIDESVNRRRDSEGSHTFHGRDVYAYTGARLAGGVIGFEGVGPKTPVDEIVRLEKNAVRFENGVLYGTVEILDRRYGHLWTDITEKNLEVLKLSYGEALSIRVLRDGRLYFDESVPFCRTFSDVKFGERLAYVNSMMCLALAVHSLSFSKIYSIDFGPDWKIEITVRRGIND
jgi:S-adenosylmethionine hydrolase